MKRFRRALIIMLVALIPASGGILALSGSLLAEHKPNHKGGGGGGGSSKKVPHIVMFEGPDIFSEPMLADMDPKNPFGNFRLGDVSDDLCILTFTSTSGVGCSGTVEGWGGYGDPLNNPWINGLVIKKRQNHVGFNGGINAVGGQINLVIKGSPIETTSEDGATTFLHFIDAKGFISSGSTPGGDYGIDNDERCVVFTISALRL